MESSVKDTLLFYLWWLFPLNNLGTTSKAHINIFFVFVTKDAILLKKQLGASCRNKSLHYNPLNSRDFCHHVK